jgi:hypothetical protein
MRPSSTLLMLSLCCAACREVTNPPEVIALKSRSVALMSSDAKYELIFFAGTEENGTAVAINERGEILGNLTGPSGSRNFRWTQAGGLETLPAGFVLDISAAGTVLMRDSEGSFLLKQSGLEYIDWGAEWSEFSFSPEALRDDGTIVGSARDPVSTRFRAFIRKQEQGVSLLPQLPAEPLFRSTSFASDVNGQGVVVGHSRRTQPIPVAWINGELAVLLPNQTPPCIEGAALAINESNAIAGRCDVRNRSFSVAFYWTQEDGGRYLSSPNDMVWAFDINNRHEVVGNFMQWTGDGSIYGPRRAYRWTPKSGFTFLESSELGTANAINERGWIVGSACVSTGCHPALWVPVGTPNMPKAGPRGARHFEAGDLEAILDEIIAIHERRFKPELEENDDQ